METAGRLVITRELLVDLLNLPEGTEILAVYDDALYHRTISVALRGPGLPTCAEGEQLQTVTATFERTETGHARFIKYVAHPY